MSARPSPLEAKQFTPPVRFDAELGELHQNSRNWGVHLSRHSTLEPHDVVCSLDAISEHTMAPNLALDMIEAKATPLPTLSIFVLSIVRLSIMLADLCPCY